MPGVRTPIAATLALLAAAGCVAACGGDDDRFGTFTDCTSVGTPAVARDPRGDQAGGGPDVTAPQADLVALRVARGGGRLCAEFQAAGDIRPSAAYALALRPTTAETPVVQVQASVLAGAEPAAKISPALGRDFITVKSDVGIDGDRLSIVVDRAEFARLGLASVFDGFRFQGRVAVVLQDDERVTDCLPSCR